MGKVVMTLLVPRQPRENATYPYAVQMTYSHEPTPGETIEITEVRFIDQDGRKAHSVETERFYNPKDWRAAEDHEQLKYGLHNRGNPDPWYRSWRGTKKSVYDYPNSGDEKTNNRQSWPELQNIDSEWEAERVKRENYQNAKEAWKKQEQAERKRRIERWGECVEEP